MNIKYYSIQLGNILRGAKDTRRGRVHGLLVGSAIDIKIPIEYDLSHWANVLTWTGMNPRPVSVYTKATEATNYKDPTMPSYMAGMKSIGARRGVYHFNRKAYDPTTQAKWFCDYVRPYIDKQTRLILDVEEYGTSAQGIVTWFEYVLGQFPENPVALYGRAEQLNQITMNASQKAFMKTIPTLAAGYPTYPNNYDTIPTAYIPDQTKFGKPTDWQYSDAGQVEGIDGAVDLNLVLDGSGTTPPPDNGGTMYKKATGNITIRTGPATSYPNATINGVGQYVLNGDILEVSEIQNGFAHIVKIYRNDVSVEIPAVSWCGTAYLQDTTYTPPVEPPPAVTVSNVKIELATGSKVITTYSDGTQKVEIA